MSNMGQSMQHFPNLFDHKALFLPTASCKLVSGRAGGTFGKCCPMHSMTITGLCAEWEVGVFCQALCCAMVGMAKNSTVMTTNGKDKTRSLFCHLSSHLLPPEQKRSRGCPQAGP